MDDEQILNMNDKIKRMLCYTIHTGKNKLQCKLGTFELIGCDILLDEKFKPYLIELNSNPAIDCDTLVKD